MYLNFKFYRTSLPTTNTTHVLLRLTFFRWHQDGVTKRRIYKPCLQVAAPIFAVLIAIIHNKTGNICVNMTLRRIRETTAPVEKQEVILHIESVCNLTYPAGKAQALYLSVVCPALQYCSKLPHKRHDFRGKKLLSTKCVCLIFSSTFVWYISHSKKNLAKYNHKCSLG
jgi:hypothetical protein